MLVKLNRVRPSWPIIGVVTKQVFESHLERLAELILSRESFVETAMKLSEPLHEFRIDTTRGVGLPATKFVLTKVENGWQHPQRIVLVFANQPGELSVAGRTIP